MKKTVLHTLWAALFILCACLGFIHSRTELVQRVLTGCGVVFFLPPAVLLGNACREKDRTEMRLLRKVSICSLGITLFGFILAIVTAPRQIGAAANAFLAVVSVPMYCVNMWALSLFLWACLLIACLEAEKKQK